MIAGLSPFTCNTGGVAEESAEDDAAEPDRRRFPGYQILIMALRY
jgi:hypothetical protein